MIRARRVYLAPMSNGDIGTGVLWHNGYLDVLRLHQDRALSLKEQMEAVFEGVEPEEMALSFPSSDRDQDRIANGAAYSWALKLRRPFTRIIMASDVQDVEHRTGCHKGLRGHFPNYACETVMRLDAALKSSLRYDVAFGSPMPLTEDAWYARMTFVAEQNTSLHKTIAGYEIALAKCEAAGVDLWQ